MKKIKFEEILTKYYIVWMFLIYPLFSKGNYFNITQCKWKMLCMVTGIFLIFWACSRITDGKWLTRDAYRWSFDGLALVVLIASIFSPYQNLVWAGGNSRYTGAFFMFMMFAMVVFVADSDITGQFQVLFGVFVLGGVITSVWTILNFVGMDPFHMHDGIIETQYRVFMAGIGNVVFLGSYLSMVIPVMFGVFLKTKVRRDEIIYGCALLLGAIGLYASGNDSGVLAVFVVLFLFFPAFLRDVQGVLKYLAGMGIIMFAGILIKMFSKYTVYGTLAFDNLLDMILRLHGFEAGFGACVIFGILIYFLREKFTVRTLRIIYYAGLVAGVFAVVLTQEQFRGFLAFGESWGNNRGYIWMKAMEIFAGEPFWQKVFGNGADTFGKLLLKYVGSDIGINGQRFDNVHCEYLQYLLSYGIVGLGAYLYAVGRILVSLIKNRERTFCLAVCAGLCGYLIQSVVGLNQVFTTPLFFILCGMGVMLARRGE